VDMIIITSFIITCAVRVTAYFLQLQVLCDIVDGLMILNVIFTYFRICDVFSLFSMFGPLMIVIRRIVADLLKIVTFVILFIICFGVTFIVVSTNEHRYTNYPNDGTLGAVWWAWLFDFSSFLEHEEFFKSYPLALVLLSVYIIVGPVFWFALLIAMFNTTYATKREQSQKEWRFTRYFTLEEYRKSNVLVPPLNLIGILFVSLRTIAKKIFFCKKNNDDLVSIIASRRSLTNNETNEDKAKKSLSKLEKRMNRAKNDFFELEESLNALKVEARIAKLSSRMEEKWKYLEVDRELDRVSLNEKLRLFNEKISSLEKNLTTLIEHRND